MPAHPSDETENASAINILLMCSHFIVIKGSHGIELINKSINLGWKMHSGQDLETQKTNNVHLRLFCQTEGRKPYALQKASCASPFCASVKWLILPFRGLCELRRVLNRVKIECDHG